MQDTNSTGGNSTAPAAQLPDWAEDLCSDYGPLALEFAGYFLWVALVIGALGALLALIVAFWTARKPKDGEGGGATPGVFSAVVTALTGLVDSLSKAPAWIVLAILGVLLLWMSTNTLPGYCIPPELREQVLDEEQETDEKNGNQTTTANPANQSTTANQAATTNPTEDREAGGRR